MVYVFFSGFPRTNNNCEGYHNKIARIIGTVQNSVFKLVDGLKDDLIDVEHTIARIEAGNDPTPQRPKYAKHEARLIKLVQKLNAEVAFDGQYMPYLLSLAHNIQMSAN